jgi:hypothetical protein
VPVAVALVLPTLAVAAPSPAHALTRDVRHSITSPQRVGAVKLVRDKGGAQRLRFAIAYPHVGRNPGRGRR